MKLIKREWRVIKEAAVKWDSDNCMRLGAALSYYTIFSLSPLLVVALGIAGLVFGREAAEGQFAYQAEGLLGKPTADAVQKLLTSPKESTNLLASIVGIVVLFIGASGAFVELKSALNKIWKVDPKYTSGVKAFVKERLLSFAMVMSIGFLLLVALIANTTLSVMGKYAEHLLPASPVFLQMANLLVSFGGITVLFAMIFKFLPDTTVKWGDVWVGSLLTSLLFSVGKFAIGMYLGQTGIASGFGASSSVVIILVWAYYSSLILFFGAEYTYVSSLRGVPSR